MTDSVTGAPIADVQCAPEGGSAVATDADGRYEVGELTGARPFTCPSLVVEFSKAGYRTMTLVDPKDVALQPQ